MARKYPVLINKEKNSAWGLSFVDINAHVIEETLEKALKEAQEAFEVYMEDEDSLPEPTALEEVAQSQEGRKSSIVLVEIDTSFFSDPTVRKTASAKLSQWETIDKAAQKVGKTRSAFLVEAALDKVASL